MEKLTMLFKGISLAVLMVTPSLAMELPQEKATEVRRQLLLARTVPLAFPLNNLDDFSNPFSRSVAILQNELNPFKVVRGLRATVKLKNPIFVRRATWFYRSRLDKIDGFYGLPDSDQMNKLNQLIEINKALRDTMPAEIMTMIADSIVYGFTKYPKCATSEDFDALYRAASPVGRSKALINFFDYFIKLKIEQKTAIFAKDGSKFQGAKDMKQADIAYIREFFYFVGDVKETVPAKLTEAERTELYEYGIKTDNVRQYLKSNTENEWPKPDTPEHQQLTELVCSPTFVMMLALERILKDDHMSCPQFVRFQKQLHANAFFGIKNGYDGVPISTRSLIMPERIHSQAYYATDYGRLHISPHFTSAMVQGIVDRDKKDKTQTEQNPLLKDLPDEGRTLELHHEVISALSPSIGVWGKDLHCLKIIEDIRQRYKLTFMPDLAALENLKEIQLSLCDIRQQWIDSFAELSNLDTLILSGVSFIDVTTLKLKGLKNLSLTNCILSQATIKLLADLPTLEVLDISGSDCSQITDWGAGLRSLLPGQGLLMKVIDNHKTIYDPQHSLKNFLETQGLQYPDLLPKVVEQPLPAVAEPMPAPQPDGAHDAEPLPVVDEETTEEKIDTVSVAEETESDSESAEQDEDEPNKEGAAPTPAPTSVITGLSTVASIPASAVMLSSTATTVLPAPQPEKMTAATPVVKGQQRVNLKMIGVAAISIGAVYAIYKGVGKIYAVVSKRFSNRYKQQKPSSSAQRTPQALRQSEV